MLKLSKVAVTGPFGAGKSTVCLVLRGLGAFVVEADVLVKELFTPLTPLGKQIIKLLGNDVVVNDSIDPKCVADIVFQNTEKLQQLENLLHPHVFQEINELYESVRQQGYHRYFVVEMPLLFEIHREQEYDFVIYVTADEQQCKKRVQIRGFTPQDYERRMQRFLPNETKQKKSHFVIENNGTLEELRKTVEEVAYQMSLTSH